MTQYICALKGISKHVSNKILFNQVYLSFIDGAKIGIIGHNGAGKSTFLKIIAGIDKNYDGDLWIADNIKVGYLAQEPVLDPNKNVFENIIEGLKAKKDLLDEFYAISAKFEQELSAEEMTDLLDKQASLQEQIDMSDAWNIDREVEIAMNALFCPDGNADVQKISGGERRRVALCKLLLEKPDILLLDEPTNHLDAESVSWLENFLKSYKGTLIVITHDRYFLDNVVEWILELDRGSCIPWHCNYSKWLVKKQEKLQQEEKEESERQKNLKKELEWISQSPKARQAKGKARINAYQELLVRKHDRVLNSPQIIIPNGPRLGSVVIEVQHVTKGFNINNEGYRLLLNNVSFIVPPGAIVGIVGPNGVGKSTLFNMIVNKEAPDSGKIVLGSTVKLGYVDQMRDELSPEKTVWEEISEGLEELQLDDWTIKTRAYCAAFNFKGNDQQKKIGMLSGGERNRVHLAKLLKMGSNVLLLDEPSNDLDLETLRQLEEAILNFAGCVMVISHDRWFLDRIATHILAFEDNNIIRWFEGNYQDYHQYMIANLGEDSMKTKYKHKKLSIN